MKKRFIQLITVSLLSASVLSGCDGVLTGNASAQTQSGPTEEELAQQAAEEAARKAYEEERSSTFQNLQGTWTLCGVCTSGEWEEYNKWYNSIANGVIDFISDDGDAADGIVGSFLKGTGVYKDQIKIDVDSSSIDLSGAGGRRYQLSELTYTQGQFSDGTPCYDYYWMDSNGNGIVIKYDYQNKNLYIFDDVDFSLVQSTGLLFSR